MNTNFQFVFACIAAFGAVQTAAWIIGQNMAKSRTAAEAFQEKLIAGMQVKRLPEYDTRFQDAERRISELSEAVGALHTANLQLQKDSAVYMHSLNNLKQRFVGIEFVLQELRNRIEEVPDKIVKILKMGKGEG